MAENPSNDQRLDSWKEIAAHIGRDKRTAMRWEKEKGLPVHRPPGGSRQRVFAYKRELDAWLTQVTDRCPATEFEKKTDPLIEYIQPPEQPLAGVGTQRVSRKYLLALVVTLGAIGTAVLMFIFITHPARGSIVTKVDFSKSGIQAFDDTGHMIWERTYPQLLAVESPSDVQSLTSFVRFVDLKRDGQREILVKVPMRMGPNPSDGTQDELDCFSNEGQLLWSYVPHEKFRFGNYDLGGPWILNDVLVSIGDKAVLIWVVLDHNRWGNSFVAQLDPQTGKDTVRFVNTGVLYKLNEIRIEARQYLLAAGFNNEYASGAIGIIDENRPYAVSPQTAGTRHKCLSCGEGAPDYYFVFPRSEINLLENLWENSVHFVNVHGDEFEIEKSESTEVDTVHTVYVFRTQPTVTPVSLRFDSPYDLMHRELEKIHKLDHTLESCPERLHPKPVRLWTPAGGWQQIALKSVRSVD